MASIIVETSLGIPEDRSGKAYRFKFYRIVNAVFLLSRKRRLVRFNTFSKTFMFKTFVVQLNWLMKSGIGIPKNYFIITKVELDM